MRRREFIALLGGAAAWPLAASGQSGQRERVIGLLTGGMERDPEYQDRVGAFRQGLRQYGWAEGHNIRIEARFTSNSPERLPAVAAELAMLAPDIVHTLGTPGTIAMQRVTKTIPIVFAQVTDPIGSGIVSNLSRPGGNITGFTNYEYPLGGKWLELLKEIAPDLQRVLFVHNPENANWVGFARAIEAAALSVKVQLVTAPIRNSADIKRELDQFAQVPHGGVLVQPDGLMLINRDRIIDGAGRHRLPAVYPARAHAVSGGLLAYAINNSDLNLRAASYVDRILRGANVGDLPVEAPTRFELIVNLKTAKASGLKIPEAFLLRADEVIE